MSSFIFEGVEPERIRCKMYSDPSTLHPYLFDEDMVGFRDLNFDFILYIKYDVYMKCCKGTLIFFYFIRSQDDISWERDMGARDINR